LLNKAEVFALLEAGTDAAPLAISSAFLQQHPLYHETLGATDIVILTDASGAHRAYATEGIEFREWNGDSRLLDTTGRAWTVAEADLESSDGQGHLNRLPAHRAFWFGWYSAYPQTRLVY